MVTNDQFRTAMSKFATGVTVITTIDENGDPHEKTANSFTSVCLEDGRAVYSYTYGTTGLPILEGSILFMGCKVVGEHIYGDHTIFVAEVEELTVPSDEDPLMFFNSRWYDPSSS